MILVMILVTGHKGAFFSLVFLSPSFKPCRIENDEDQWLCKFALKYLLTLWFNDGRESVISSDRCFSLAHKLVRWEIRCRPILGLVPRQSPLGQSCRSRQPIGPGGPTVYVVKSAGQLYSLYALCHLGTQPHRLWVQHHPIYSRTPVLLTCLGAAAS